MPDNGSPDTKLSVEGAIKQAVEQTLADEGTPAASTESESTSGATDGAKKTRTYQEVLDGLPPTDREVMESTLKSLQSSKDKALSKLQGVDDTTLQAVRSIQSDPKLLTAVQSAIADYQTGKSTSSEAKTAVKDAVEDTFDAMMEDPNLSGQDRAVLRRFRGAIVKESQKVMDPYDKRLSTVESLVLKSKMDERNASLSTLKEQMGEALYDKYLPDAQRYIDSGYTPASAFRAVMEDPDDLAAWATKLRPKPSKPVAVKKVASEVGSTAVPAAEEGLYKPGASQNEQKKILNKGIMSAVTSLWDKL